MRRQWGFPANQGTASRTERSPPAKPGLGRLAGLPVVRDRSGSFEVVEVDGFDVEVTIMCRARNSASV
jgi:hypothetical protein